VIEGKPSGIPIGPQRTSSMKPTDNLRRAGGLSWESNAGRLVDETSKGRFCRGFRAGGKRKAQGGWQQSNVAFTKTIECPGEASLEMALGNVLNQAFHSAGARR
jgi:hypothetical protein